MRPEQVFVKRTDCVDKQEQSRSGCASTLPPATTASTPIEPRIRRHFTTRLSVPNFQPDVHPSTPAARTKSTEAASWPNFPGDWRASIAGTNEESSSSYIARIRPIRPYDLRSAPWPELIEGECWDLLTGRGFEQERFFKDAGIKVTSRRTVTIFGPLCENKSQSTQALRSLPNRDFKAEALAYSKVSGRVI